MRCYLCDTEVGNPFMGYSAPDKYMDIIYATGSRHWYYCEKCLLYWQGNSLTDDDLQSIYLKYRDEEMRGTTVEAEYKRISTMPDSENQTRTNQLLMDGVLQPGKTLDIGSGLGVFPSSILPYVKDVTCIEPEPTSAKFIHNRITLCHNGFYAPGLAARNDLVTAVHILEHMRDPIKFLRDVVDVDLKPGGTMYIEVPDSKEFKTLSFDHDEFNSTHIWFFNIPTLVRIAESAGLSPYLIRTLTYPERNLSRVYMLCKNQ